MDKLVIESKLNFIILNEGNFLALRDENHLAAEYIWPEMIDLNFPDTDIFGSQKTYRITIEEIE